MNYPRVRFEKILDVWQIADQGVENREALQVPATFGSVLDLASSGGKIALLQASDHPFPGAEVLHRHFVDNEPRTPEAPPTEAELEADKKKAAKEAKAEEKKPSTGPHIVNYQLRSFRGARRDFLVEVPQIIIDRFRLKDFPEEIFFKGVEEGQ